MTDLTGTRVVITRDSGIMNGAEFKKFDCTTCRYEGGDMKCHHPLEGTKKFLNMEMEDCHDHNNRATSLGNKARLACRDRKVLECSKKAK